MTCGATQLWCKTRSMANENWDYRHSQPVSGPATEAEDYPHEDDEYCYICEGRGGVGTLKCIRCGR